MTATIDPLIVTCRYCGAAIGQPCIRKGREPFARTHTTRLWRASKASKA